MKFETTFAKIIAALIILLFIMWARQGNAGVLRQYNPKLTVEQEQQMEKAIGEAGKKFNIPASLIKSIIVVESSARPRVISRGGDYGLMQVRWSVHHKDFGVSKEQLLESQTNIFIGTEIFARYYAQKKNVYAALVRYSGGNQSMANKVMKIWRRLK